MTTPSPTGIEQLLAIMARLRDPENGCPWDLRQDFSSIAPHTLEECYELIDAIERDQLDELPGELGDLLFQVVFYARLGQERELFDFAVVVEQICEKLVRRHPHVFAEDGAAAPDAAAVSRRWEEIKAQERASRSRYGLLDDVALALPALSRAAKLQRRAAGAGFDWENWRGALAKVREETAELEQAIAREDGSPEQGGARSEELGDLLFSCVNLARHLGVEPETALRTANRKFERRFAHIEAALREQGREPADATLAEMDALWAASKRTGL